VQYTSTITSESGQYYPDGRSIPFVGLYVGRPSCDKPLAQFAKELDLVFTASGDTSFNTCSYWDLVRNEPYRRAFLDAVKRHETEALRK
jgi:hypothetical protein